MWLAALKGIHKESIAFRSDYTDFIQDLILEWNMT